MRSAFVSGMVVAKRKPVKTIDMKKLIRTNNKGQLFYEIEQNEFYIEFGNVEFTLPMEEYLLFERRLKDISNDLSRYNSTDKIKIAIKSVGITLVLSPEELITLRDLFGFKSAKLMAFKMKINYSIN